MFQCFRLLDSQKERNVYGKNTEFPKSNIGLLMLILPGKYMGLSQIWKPQKSILWLSDHNVPHEKGFRLGMHNLEINPYRALHMKRMVQ
jgi:uncharacterized protein (DUF3820 family)